MRERAAKPRPVRRRDVYTEADGLFGRLTDLVIENPVRSGGFVMVVMVIGTIISNAAYFQTAHHPAPFFVTRAGDEETAAPAPKTRAATVASPSPSASLSTSQTPAVAAANAPPLPTAAPDSATLVADTQRALAALKLYDGPIDGKIGPQTRAALSSFEMRIGLVPTGQPSARLLVQLKKALPRTSAATPDEIVPPALIPTSASGATDPAASDPTATGSIDHAQSAARIRKVQTALNDIGYGPIRVDGKGGGDTEDAIRRFQLDNGLALTGEADDALMAKLVMIGAMKSI
ncbi:Peptidoglycan-binding (PGRP) domain of peptidoglycan hydrolases-containing protein [Kaistia soli DSM 19436]|uniref:Peptidoglycan-binding (PGRP) domain of peptidoglycan hydrolases-containing protein n=1 Tax=Kaistia soli DSM 19436 TaxID=1122133 RepID=A0A1M4V224_9HYPH|nr:peptidoglycan-binding domain-containing protein [Kaistia soli]SHE62937.1 Peptidoglycan-binding (PGRP) domain of peptidoglycan hydrolases-containing protein [Kaistia soli DSM 19436]